MVKASHGHQPNQALQIVGTPVQAVPFALDAGLGGFVLLDEVEHDAAQDGKVLGAVADAQLAVVLTEDDIEHPVALVLDVPVLADAAVELCGIERRRADVVTPVGAALALLNAVDCDRWLPHETTRSRFMAMAWTPCAGAFRLRATGLAK